MAHKKPKDHYKTLGIAYTATEEEIKNAYRSLARKYHPDVNPGDKQSEEKFKEVYEAFSILKDEKQRYLLDLAMGVKNIDPTQKIKPRPRTGTPETQKPKTRPKQASKTTSSKNRKDNTFSEAFSSLFENIMSSKEPIDKKQAPRFTTDPPPAQETKKEKATYTSTGPRPKQPKFSERGEDITLDIYLIKNEAINGCIRTVNILHTDTCSKCKGSGILAASQCQYCQGKGESSFHKKIDVKIPAGIKNGSKVRIAKEGNKGPNEGDRGDLYLNVKVYNPASFEFDNYDVLSEVMLTPYEAALGTEIQVLTIDGILKMKVPEGTQPGQKFRLLKQGLPAPDGERGNHFVKINIEIPKNLSPKEKELYKELARLDKKSSKDYIE